MKAILRSAIVAAGMAAALATTMVPAGAVDAGAFSGTAQIDCFGCGDSPGTASLDILAGTVTGHVNANYTAHEGTGADCVIRGTAEGTTTGAVTVSFTWTRLGATALISTTGSVNGAGVAGFHVSSPSGIPCGFPVTADVVGVLVGNV